MQIISVKSCVPIQRKEIYAKMVTGKKAKNLQPLGYLAVLFLSNVVATYASILISRAFITIESEALRIVLFLVSFVGTVFLVTEGAVFFMFKKTVPKNYEETDDSKTWLKNALFIILPAEIVRLIVCMFDLGFMNGTGKLCILVTLLFEQTYLVWFGRMDAVRQDVDFIFMDYIGFAACYMFYFVFHVLVVLLIYRYFWKKTKDQYSDLIVR